MTLAEELHAALDGLEHELALRSKQHSRCTHGVRSFADCETDGAVADAVAQAAAQATQQNLKGGQHVVEAGVYQNPCGRCVYEWLALHDEACQIRSQADHIRSSAAMLSQSDQSHLPQMQLPQMQELQQQAAVAAPSGIQPVAALGPNPASTATFAGAFNLGMFGTPGGVIPAAVQGNNNSNGVQVRLSRNSPTRPGTGQKLKLVDTDAAVSFTHTSPRRPRVGSTAETPVTEQRKGKRRCLDDSSRGSSPIDEEALTNQRHLNNGSQVTTQNGADMASA